MDKRNRYAVSQLIVILTALSLSSCGGSNTEPLANMSPPPPPAPGTASLTVSWTPPTRNTDGTVLTDLAAYKIHYGPSSGNYTNEVRVDNPGLATLVIDNLSPTTYYVAVTAINAGDIESDFSNEAMAVAR